MASVGHIAVGMAAARVYQGGRRPRWPSMASWSALSLLPDADVIGFALGVDYGDPWGHRGATHSLAFSVAAGLAIGLAARPFKQPVVRTALIAALVLASHAVLDTMTDGGLGCALFWPFDLTRYFAPWRPIPVAPIGPDFFSSAGASVAAIELVLFAPLLVFARRSREIAAKPVVAGVLLALWSVSAWMLVSGDRVRDAILGFFLREETAYTRGFSEEAFRAIRHGQADTEVRHLLGAPFREDWIYPPKDQPLQSPEERSALISGECLLVRFENDVVVSARDPDACTKLGIGTGRPPAEVHQRLGLPPERCWHYSWSPSGAHFRIRVVCFTDARVAMIVRQWN